MIQANNTNISQENNTIQKIKDTKMATNKMNIKIGNTLLTAMLANNPSVDALVEALKKAPITINKLLQDRAILFYAREALL